MTASTEKWPTSEARGRLIEQYLKRTETQKDFCKVHGLSRSTLQSWLRRYRPGPGSGQQGFIEVAPVPGAGVLARLEIEYPNGVKVRPGPEISMEVLGKLIKLQG